MNAIDIVLMNRLIAFDIDDCGSCHIVNSLSGTISSPNFPDNYGGNLNCVYYIHVPAGYLIQVSFNNFTVERDYDFISVSKIIQDK